MYIYISISTIYTSSARMRQERKFQKRKVTIAKRRLTIGKASFALSGPAWLVQMNEWMKWTEWTNEWMKELECTVTLRFLIYSISCNLQHFVYFTAFRTIHARIPRQSKARQTNASLSKHAGSPLGMQPEEACTFMGISTLQNKSRPNLDPRCTGWCDVVLKWCSFEMV